MTIDEMRNRRREMGYTYEMLSEESGVPVATIQKIFSGTTLSPRRDTILALENVLKQQVVYTLSNELTPLQVQEQVSDFGKIQGELTAEDLMTLPEDFRYELIDGVLFNLAVPVIDHQTIVEEIYLQFREGIRKNNGKCIVRELPTAIYYDKKNQLIPDLFVLCDKKKLGRKYLMGSPDLIVEVLSPSTKQKDLTVKLAKYSEKGVRECWFADPKKERVIVYTFSDPEDNIINIYSFEDEIPVGIFEGRLKIDMKAVKRAVEDFYF
ncbi:MAG: Uma2 family endonuclease [Firmicutes bacterium]|nr:Uma2 family endonuclease [Bacillota bacterium]